MANQIVELHVPDMGGAANVDVIAVMISSGTTIAVDDSLITLEGDKASMDVPSTVAGVVDTVSVKVGDKVKEGSLICTVRITAAHDEPKQKASVAPQKISTDIPIIAPTASSASLVHASPAVRRLARELNISLAQILGTGEKGRVTKEDVKQYLSGSDFSPSVTKQPVIDFSKFGEIDTQSLSKIKKISGANLHRNWVSIPHVTQFAEADITDLENFRLAHKNSAEKKGFKLTPLVFIMKAVVAALKEFPIFNASLDASSENLIFKKYFHVGVAVDTPNGLVVPVIRDVDQKNLFELAKELADISEKARTKGLSIIDMQGGCFSISSLGGIGGTAFTPIINAPEVAILGISKSSFKPYYQEGTFVPRMMLPLSLSYDHRVIDGADGARFVAYLSQCLSDIRNLLL